ncbi:hypothetical protein F7U66_00155 [Vibrio parahaemolyticus]|nr:hypothetical protein [Vibrio parahaemolyticus]
MKYAKLVHVFDGRLQVALMAFKNSPSEYPSLKASYLDTDGQITTIELAPETEKTMTDYHNFYNDFQLLELLETIIAPRMPLHLITKEQKKFASEYHAVDSVGQVIYMSEGSDTDMYFMVDNETVAHFGIHGASLEEVEAMSDHQKFYYIEMARGNVPQEDVTEFGPNGTPRYLN